MLRVFVWRGVEARRVLAVVVRIGMAPAWTGQQRANRNREHCDGNRDDYGFELHGAV